MFLDFLLSNLLGIVSLCCIVALFFWINSKISVYNDGINNRYIDENKRLSALETFLHRGILLDTQDKIAQKYAIQDAEEEEEDENINNDNIYNTNLSNKIEKNDNIDNNSGELFNKCIEDEYDKLINNSIIDVNDTIFKLNNESKIDTIEIELKEEEKKEFKEVKEIEIEDKEVIKINKPVFKLKLKK